MRLRLAVAVAALVGVATGATTLVVYTAATDRLRGEVDRFLADRSAAIVAWSETTDATIPTGNAPNAAENSPVHYDVEIQVLDDTGALSIPADGATLPIDPADAPLARSGGAPRLRNVVVDGTPYRVRTTPLRPGGAIQVARDVSETERVLSALKYRFAAIGLAVVAAGIVAGWLLARRITRPLRRLTQAAGHVAHSGDLTADIPGTRADETGRLAAAFRAMLTALSHSRDQQQRLIQDAGHELRTPLTSMRTNIEVLERHRDLTAVSRSEILADLRVELDEVAAMVDELVGLADEETADDAPTEVSLRAVADRAAERATRRHGREIEVIGSDVLVIGRAFAIDRALTNLIDNAVKFSTAPAPIEVIVEGPTISVRDHGAGVDTEDLAHIFDRFYRALPARQLPGSGLGLAIVRSVAESHGGRAFATNHPDGGAVIGLALASVDVDRRTHLVGTTRAEATLR